MKATKLEYPASRPPPIDPESLGFGGLRYDQITGSQLHLVCITHMSAFAMEPSLERAQLVEALLSALQQHPERFSPNCTCDPYARVKALWARMVTLLAAREHEPACLAVRH